MSQRRVLLKQADGHAGVVFRSKPQSGVDSKNTLPNGTIAFLLGREGEYLKVQAGTKVGYVKARNVKLIAEAPAKPVVTQQTAPAPTTTTPVVASTVAPLKASTVVTFTINGLQHTIDTSKSDIPVDLSVHDWIVANIPGSGIRRSCGVGRCGSCVCSLSFFDNTLKKNVVRSFNSCLRPILSCNNMHITTIAGIGNAAKPHPCQEALAKHSGTQCGFCSAGMVMNLYSKLTDDPNAKFTSAQLDKSIDGNYCRCTGYRPILDAYKSFASDAESKVEDKTTAQKIFNATPLEKPAANTAPIEAPLNFTPKTTTRLVASDASGSQWFTATTAAELTGILNGLPTTTKDVFKVAGHTSQGLYQGRKSDVYVSIGNIPELSHCTQTATSVTIGSTTTLTNMLDFFEGVVKSLGATSPKVKFLQRFIEHGTRSPGNNVRNTGTVGGNLSLAFEHQNDGLAFPLEWPMLFEAAGATLTIVNAKGNTSSVVTIPQYYAISSDVMKFSFIQSISVPFSEEGDVFVSYKIGARHVYSEAFASAAMKVNVTDAVVTAGKTRMVFNGMGTPAARMTSLETAMDGMTVTDQAKFTSLVKIIQTTLKPAEKAAYRIQLCVSFFYKFFLGLQPNLPANLKSAVSPWMEKDLTSGKQAYTPNPAEAPVSMPIQKIDGLKQCTGEVEYIQNIPLAANTVHGAIVWSTQIGDFQLDPSAASALPGYKGVITAADVPNNGTVLLASQKTLYIGQAIVIVLAATRQQASDCAAAFGVQYTNSTTAVIDLNVAAQDKSRHMSTQTLTTGDVNKAFASAAHVVTDTWDLGPQYHFHMETQSAYAMVGGEGGVVVHSATQMPVVVQQSVAATLNQQPSAVDIRNRRCGGGFGGKLTNSVTPACFAAVATNKTKLPVSIVYEQSDNMLGAGLRPPWQMVTKIAFDDTGKVSACQFTPFVGAGYTDADVGFSLQAFIGAMDNCYNVPNWNVVATAVKLDLPANTAMRAPGWLPGIFNAERVIATVARTLNMDPVDVRTVNFYKKNDVTPYKMPLAGWDIDSLWAKTKQAADYDNRQQQIDAFNKANTWVKKGLALVPSKFGVGYGGSAKENVNMFDVNLIVNADSTISVMCGGTEIGQGLTTKVVQTIARALDVPMDIIQIVEQTTTVIGKTGCSDATGGSISSELTCWAARNACNSVNTALAPVRKLLPGATWKEIVTKAYSLGIALTFQTNDQGVSPPSIGPHLYNTYGCVALECTMDILTGQVDFNLAEIVYDLGQSVNPLIDIGQVEGAFIMGLGLTVTEDVGYYPNGFMRWWEYLIPTPWEIPTEMNVTLMKEIPNTITAGGGKACGEPPITCTYAAVEAIEKAAAAAATSLGKKAIASTATPFTGELRMSASQFTAGDLKFQ